MRTFIYKFILISFTILCELCLRTASDEHSHIYEDNDEVVLWVNTVGPYHNRQETYSYFSLPLCAGTRQYISRYHATLGEILLGFRLQYSGLDIDFKANVNKTYYCEMMLTELNIQTFMYALKNNYSYQMFIDDLPIWGMLGEFSKQDNTYRLWTHKKFEIGFNGKQIVDVNLTNDDGIKLELDKKVSFTYEVNWKESSTSFSERFNKYLDPSFFQHRLHWFSIFSSFMMVIVLVGLVSMILLRTLRKNKEMDNKQDLGDEFGWKQVHGDVFRTPSNPLFLSIMIGSGYQIAFVTFIVIIFAIMGKLYTERGSLLSTAIFVYAASSSVNGYFGGSLYAQYGGKKWIKQMFLSAAMFPSLVCGTTFLINLIALYYQTSRVVPFSSVIDIACICIFIILPTLVGTILGRNINGQANHPCHVNEIPRPIPKKKWFIDSMIIILGGILPFGSIFIEINFLFTSFWTYKIYYVYGFMFLIFIILTAVTICVAIVCTYFLLNAQDYRWQWTSFMAGASTAGYVYLYSFYYFFFKTKMYGLFQTTFYFGYTALFCIALGLMCGTFGYLGASLFVKKIYSTIHCPQSIFTLDGPERNISEPDNFSDVPLSMDNDTEHIDHINDKI